MTSIISSLESYLEKVNKELLNSSLLIQNDRVPTNPYVSNRNSSQFVKIDLPRKLIDVFGSFLAVYGDSIRSFVRGKSIVHFESPVFIIRHSDDIFHVLFGITVRQKDIFVALIIATSVLVLLAVTKFVFISVWDTCDEIIDLYSELGPEELSVSDDSSDFELFDESAYIPLLVGLCEPNSNFPALKDHGSMSLYEDFEARTNKFASNSPVSSDATIVAVDASQNRLLRNRPLQRHTNGQMFIVSAEYLLLLMPTINSWLEQLPICASASDIVHNLKEVLSFVSGDTSFKIVSEDILLLRFFVSTDYMGSNDHIRGQVMLITSKIAKDPSAIITALENDRLQSDCKVELMLLVSALAIFDVYDGFCASLMEALLMVLLKIRKLGGTIATFAEDSFCVMMASSSGNLLFELFSFISEAPDESEVNLMILIRSLSFYMLVNDKALVHELLIELTSNKLHNSVIRLVLQSHNLYRKHANHLQECQHLGTTFTLLEEMTTLYNVVLGVLSKSNEIPSPIQLELIDSVVSKIYCTLKEEECVMEIEAPSVKGMGAK